MPDPAYLTLAQAAAKFGVSRITLWRWASTPGKIPGAWQAGPRAWMIPESWTPPARVRAGWPKGKKRH
jgi:hypothetical protein